MRARTRPIFHLESLTSSWSFGYPPPLSSSSSVVKNSDNPRHTALRSSYRWLLTPRYASNTAKKHRNIPLGRQYSIVGGRAQRGRVGRGGLSVAAACHADRFCGDCAIDRRALVSSKMRSRRRSRPEGRRRWLRGCGAGALTRQTAAGQSRP